MAEHVVTEAVLVEDVGLGIAAIGLPVVGELLGAEHQNRLVAKLVVLDDRESGEGFSEADAIGQDAAVVGLQLVDQARGGIALEVEELLPDQGVLIARSIVGEHVFIDVFQELPKDVVEHQEVDALGRVLLVHGRNVIAEPCRHVF